MNWADVMRETCRGSASDANAVIRAIEALLARDAYLLQVNVNERTIAHRLAIYLEQEFPGWSVDCEYNRDGHDPKEIAYGSGDDMEHGSRVYPDVIIHKRGTSINHIVIELKKSNNPEPDERDFEKLRGYCSQVGYSHGVFVRLSIGRRGPGVARAEFVYPLRS